LVDTHAVKALATKTLYHNSACYSLPATGEIRNTIDPRQVNVIITFQNLPAIMMWNAPIPYGTSICNSIGCSRQSCLDKEKRKKAGFSVSSPDRFRHHSGPHYDHCGSAPSCSGWRKMIKNAVNHECLLRNTTKLHNCRHEDREQLVVSEHGPDCGL
jgi:hypothetical protein